MDLERDIYQAWDTARWPNFSESEIACRHCGQSVIWGEFLDKLQLLRTHIGRPIYILSAHRCAVHNARVGGAPLSEHLKLAVDISLYQHDRFVLDALAKQCAFRGFGYYSTFLHLDLGRARQWFIRYTGYGLWPRGRLFRAQASS